MNEDKILQESGALLEMFRKGIESGGEFVMSQAPAIAKEILAYQLVSSIVFAIVIGGGCLMLWKALLRHWKAMEPDLAGLLITLLGATTIFVFVFVLCQATTILKTTLAPRVYLLEYVADLAGKLK